jgi:hypothetical protein
MIFNLGSDINLLKAHRQPSKQLAMKMANDLDSVSSLPDYYKICAFPPVTEYQQSISEKLQLKEQSTKKLELRFSIQEIVQASQSHN